MDAVLLTASQNDICQLTPLQSAILKTLFYFDIFHYPLTTEELEKCCLSENPVKTEFKAALNYLVEKKYIGQKNGYYMASPDENILLQRLEGNKRAEQMMKKSFFYSKLISRFPFVEAVFISGSLAKGCVDKKGDVDYFVIARPGRLWVCRTLLMLFKKIFLFNSRKYFCINYFIDSDHLTIPDQNLFTATEIAFLKPVYNPAVCKRFLEQNKWVRVYYPSMPDPDTAEIIQVNRSFFRMFFEWILKGQAGERWDIRFLRISLNRWKRKFSHIAPVPFELNFRSNRSTSKHHPSGFQNKVLDQYEMKLCEFMQRHQVSL
jgi:hypothetical protein